MEIDGYNGIDPKTVEEGIELEIPTRLGVFHIRAKFASDDNSEFQQAQIELLKGQTDDVDANYRAVVGMWYDTVIRSWRTTVKSKGKVVKPTRENFIDLMELHPFRPVFIKLREQAGDWRKFEREKEEKLVEEAVKN